MTIDKNKLLGALNSKIEDSAFKTLFLGFVAGVYISMGAIIYSLVTSMDGNPILLRFFGAFLFCGGLILVILKKAQLFTGNNLMFLNFFGKQTTPLKILRNWFLVYFGNFIGAILMAIALATIFSQIQPIRENIIAIAQKKTSYPFEIALYKAIFCNMLVCSAVVLGVCLKTLSGRIIGIIIPITIFVFMGFEHSIANMFFIPTGLLVGDFNGTFIMTSFIKNIIPVTFGNIIGGFLLSLGISRL